MLQRPSSDVVGVKSAVDKMEINGCEYVPIELYLQKQAASFGTRAIVCQPLIYMNKDCVLLLVLHMNT